MSITTSQHNGLTMNQVVRDKNRLAYLEISSTVRAQHSPLSVAIRLIYASALLAGAGTLNRAEFIDAESKLGIKIHVIPSPNYISITLESIDDNLRGALKLLSLIIKSPTFSKSELKRIKIYIKNILELSKEDASLVSYNNFLRTTVTPNDRRYPFTMDEIIIAIDSVTQTHLHELHTKFRTNPWIATCGGSAESCTEINTFLSSIRHNHTEEIGLVHEKSLPSPLQRRVVTLESIAHKQNVEISIGNIVPLLRNDNDFLALSLGMSVLALPGGFAGRLMSIVREKEGLTYMIYGEIENTSIDDYGFWRIRTFFSPKDTKQGIKSTFREIENITRDGITHDELVHFKSILQTRAVLTNDSLIRKVREIQSVQKNGLTIDQYQDYLKRQQAVTVAEVNHAIQKYIDVKKLVISAAGPVRNIKADLNDFTA